ncbi:hypothetical protein [Acidithiobacillus sp. AMEEHan]|uniref:hypothetical protein n=1 Tax=Acidithiobacillus sp. AMEEHan TaxID=2994951 RepID=UPI0027E50A2B|nr:hypothetical protein [Acidithiobacillus sp. AMEEHan]
MLTADHPSVAGHFPGNPIVPGALMLDRILETLPVPGPILIRSVKFLRIVRPGAMLQLRWQSREEGQIHFFCYDRGEVVLTGTLESK